MQITEDRVPQATTEQEMEICERVSRVIRDGISQPRLLIVEAWRSGDLLRCVLPPQILNSLADLLHGPMCTAGLINGNSDIIPEPLQRGRKPLVSQCGPAGT